MDLLLRGRGTEIGARAPLSLVRLSGAALGYATLGIADRLGFGEVTGLSSAVAKPVALLVGALLAPSAYGAVLWWLCGALVTISMVVAFTPIIEAPAQHFVRQDVLRAPVEAIVVLSGAMTDDRRLKQQALDRLLSALAEARKRGVRTIALSVIDRGTGSRHVTSQPDQRALMALLAPDLTVQYVRDVRTTHDEALQFAALANTNGWHRVAVVTSPMHTRRACRTIEVAGLSVECVPAQSRSYSLSRLESTGARLDAFEDVMYETAATMLYSFRGWI